MTPDNMMWIIFGIGMVLQSLSIRSLEAKVKKLEGK